MRSLARALLFCLLAVLLNGCQEQRDPNRITVWTALEGKEFDNFKSLCEASGQSVDILKVPFSGLKDKFMIAAPAGQGPDLILGPQDWLGVFVTTRQISPLPEEEVAKLRGDTMETALKGVTVEGQVYAAPLVLDCLALIRNTSLVPTAPKDSAELVSMALQIQKGDVKGFYYDIQDMYFSWPFFAAQGAEVFKNGLEPGFTGPEGAAALTFLKSLRDTGLVPVGAKNDFAKSLFLEGKVGMTLNGPWFLADIKAKKVPYAIDVIPGGPKIASPFVGITGLMLSSHTRNRDGALKLLDYLSSTESQVKMSLASGRPPARKSSLALASKDAETGQDILAFARVAESGVPMPTHPAASVVWDPMKQALELATKGEGQPAELLEHTRESVEAKIRQMME